MKTIPGYISYVFVISSIALVVGIGLTYKQDHDAEWKEHQRRYKILAEAATDNLEIKKTVRSMPVKTGQVFLRKPLHVDRCVSCHLGYDNPNVKDAPKPYRTHSKMLLVFHPVREFGCTSCHGGQGTATTYEGAAHEPIEFWDDPVLPLEVIDSRCAQCHVDETPRESMLLAEGRDITLDKGCHACHEMPGIGFIGKPGPSLEGIGVKTGRSWLRKWIADPRNYLENPKMPTFRLDLEKVNALAEYLLTQDEKPLKKKLLLSDIETDEDSGKKIFNESRCLSCHSKGGKGGTLAPDLIKVADKVTPQWLFEWLKDPHYFQPSTQMLRFRFSDQEAADLAAYLLAEFTEADEEELKAKRKIDLEIISQPLAKDGKRLFAEVGCPGCHDVKESHKIAKIGPELKEIGALPLASLSFGEHTDVKRRRENWLFWKIKEPDFIDPKAKMPDFHLTDDEAARIVIALMGMRSPLLTRKPVSGQREEKPFNPSGQFGKLFKEYRCLTCHQVNGVGGTIATVDLAREGSRVQKEWLYNYLKVPYAVRPMVIERMPRFRMSDQEASVFVNYISQVFIEDSIPEMDDENFTDTEIVNGEKLFGQKGCRACHSIQGKGGYVGPDLLQVGDRLRPGWIFSWLLDPVKYKPDSMMPVFGFTRTEARELTAFLMQQRRKEPQPQANPLTPPSPPER